MQTTFKPIFSIMQHRRCMWHRLNHRLPAKMIWFGPQPGQRWCSAAVTVVEPGGVWLAEGMEFRWGWRWSCWCHCFSSGHFAPHWEPAGPSLLKNYHSTPAEGSTSSELESRREQWGIVLQVHSRRGSAGRFLTMKAGITGCWNLVLKVCINCLVLAL